MLIRSGTDPVAARPACRAPARAPHYAVACAVLASIGILASGARAQVVTRNMTLMSSRNDYPATVNNPVNYSACWSYIHGDGREYAAIGVNGLSNGVAGTAIYNVTDPANPHPVGLIPGPGSVWREMKSYRNWLYVVSEGRGAGEGLQIIRMTDPEHPVLAATYTTSFLSSHTVSIDTTRGILICNGTNGPLGATGMRILALNNSGIGATPETPVEIAWWPGGPIPVPDVNYVHDSVPIGNRLYASSIYAGLERVLDFTNPAAPSQIAAISYPGAFTHNSWPDPTGRWLYVTDEVKGEPLKIFDILSLTSPVEVNGITSNPEAIVHNAHVMGNELYLSNYTEGIRGLDLSDAAHPAEFAFGDSYPGPSGGYGGVWEVCPFFPSGTVIASDRNTGLYLYRVTRDYGIVRATVVDAANGQPLAGVEVTLTTQGDSLTTPADGIVRFAPSPGTHTVRAHKFGWVDATATRAVTIGSHDDVTLALAARPAVAFDGTVRSSVSGLPLDGAEVSLAYTPLHEHTGPDGHYSLTVPDDTYQLEVRRAGFVPVVLQRRIGPGFPGRDYALVPAPVWQDLETDPGWTVGAAGDNATTGIWTRVTPIGTGPRPPASEPEAAPYSARRAPSPMHCAHCDAHGVAVPNLAPYADHTPGSGTMCFVTGQGDSINYDLADVDLGKTTLTTPALDATGMLSPTISFWRWFISYWFVTVSSGTGGPDPSDYLAVLISNDNGASWTPVDTTRGSLNHWAERSVRVADYVTPTSQVKLRFVAADLGPVSIVEAAIDDLALFDGATAVVSIGPPGPNSRLAFRSPWPDPASGAVTLVLDIVTPGTTAVDVLDVTGRSVRSLFRGAGRAGPLVITWDGDDDSGRPAPAGLYFARAIAGPQSARTRFVWVR